MRAVDRGCYAKDRGTAYVDAPQSIGSAATISAPHMHAYALELMRDHLRPGARCLDVGSGSGYLTSVMAHMVAAAAAAGGKSAEVKATGVEHIPELHETSLANVRGDPSSRRLLESGRLELLVSDGRMGHESGAPYDCIHVGAAAPSIPPALEAQLGLGGRLVIPVGEKGATQDLVVVDKGAETGDLRRRKVMGVVYVPLCERDHQLNKRWR